MEPPDPPSYLWYNKRRLTPKPSPPNRARRPPSNRPPRPPPVLCSDRTCRHALSRTAPATARTKRKTTARRRGTRRPRWSAQTARLTCCSVLRWRRPGAARRPDARRRRARRWAKLPGSTRRRILPTNANTKRWVIYSLSRRGIEVLSIFQTYKFSNSSEKFHRD